MEHAVHAWNSMGYFEGFLFTLWIVGLYWSKLKLDQRFSRKTIYRIKLEKEND